MLVKGLAKAIKPCFGYCEGYNYTPSDYNSYSSYALFASCGAYHHKNLTEFNAQPPWGLDVLEMDEFPKDDEIKQKPNSDVECLTFGDTKLVFRFLREY